MLCKNYHIKISVSVLSSHLRFFHINRSVITCFGSVKRKFQGICSREISISSHEFDLRLFSFVIEIPQLVLLRTKYPIKITVQRNHALSVKSRHKYFRFFWKKVDNIVILEQGPVSNESPGNFTYYKGIL